MREPPRLANALIIDTLQAHYNLFIATLTFLPIGNDSASVVYRVDGGDGQSYFLKVRSAAGFSPPSLIIPRFLQEQHIPHIVAPVPTMTQELWVNVDNFALSLYPYIDARTAAEAGLSEQHWRTLGTTLRRIHTRRLPVDLNQLVPHEMFIPSRRNILDQLDSYISNHRIDDAIQRELALFWHSRRDKIRKLIATTDRFGAQLSQISLPFVLCHADLHTWNVLLDTDKQLWVVDWDETILAPKERDLMFVIGGIGQGLVKSNETMRFLEGYGDTAINRQALTYYRYAWAVQDIAAYAETVFLLPDVGDEVRSDAVRGFIDLFSPGNIVAIADNEEHSI
jgi:spectinomycin phosphotransferase